MAKSLSFLFLHSKTISFPIKPFSMKFFSPKPLFFSTTATPYPLQYELILSHPVNSHKRTSFIKPQKAIPNNQEPQDSIEAKGLDNWVDRKISENNKDSILIPEKSKRKYYNKRRKRMYGGTDSDEEKPGGEEEAFVELRQEVVDFPRLHQREEELYFYDAFAYPWEKDKHYKMVYQLEKKYFPGQCFDNAFVEPGKEGKGKGRSEGGKGKTGEKKGRMDGGEGGGDNKGMVFFEEGDEKRDVGLVKDVTEKKVEEFFKCLKKVPGKKDEVVSEEPYFVSRKTELPARWDGPKGTVVLVNKPKGWTSFTVCGKLRRLVKVQKVGHAGTLDPMATGLLIVCVGKATKVVDRYQGMVKGYSGVFRLGEATSTWDADSPVIQREPWEFIKDEDIKKAAANLTGEIWQVPPMFSAIKVGGEKMYEKARRGETVELSPRRISIFKFDIERSLNDRQNLIFRVTCSKGTYIRSLCADLGKALGSCAHMTALRRDSIGEYLADDAWEFQELEEAITKGYL